VGAASTDTVTFLFTDVAGSTRLWREHPCYGAGESSAKVRDGAFCQPSRKQAFHRAYRPGNAATPAGTRRPAPLLRRTSERGERLIRTLSESFHGKKPVVPAICVLPERLGVLEFQELLDLQVLLVDLRDLQEIPVRLVRKGSKEPLVRSVRKGSKE